MRNRSELQNEYGELINSLNSTNRKADEKTEIIFSIRELTKNQKNLVVTVNFEKYLSLGKMSYLAHLNIDGNFKFQAFAEYIKNAIKDSKSEAEIISTIRFAINRLFAA